MSLELISNLEFKLEEDKIADLIERINNTDYKNVYHFEEFSSYGFIRTKDEYTDGAPPLFDLIISESFISVLVYGDLNDLEKIRRVIVLVFQEMAIPINLIEEGED